jgi:hypothetical protein
MVPSADREAWLWKKVTKYSHRKPYPHEGIPDFSNRPVERGIPDNGMADIGTIQGTRATKVTKATKGTPMAAYLNSSFL